MDRISRFLYAMKNIIRTIVDRELRSAGYQRLGSRWYKSKPEVAVVIDVQRSVYDAQHFINIGFWIKDLGLFDKPRTEQCHIKLRASSLPLADDEDFGKLLNLDEEMDEGERERRWSNFVRNAILPFCDDNLSVEGLCKTYSKGQFRDALVLKGAHALLQSLS